MNYTLYMHVFPNDKKYVGITSKNPLKRWASGTGYKGQFVYKAILKYGWDNIEHKIISKHLSKEEAEELEINLIKDFSTTDRKYGYNIENGGNASDRLTPEIREKISKKLKGVPKGTHNIKKYKAVWNDRSESEKDRLKNIRSKEVYQFTLDGEMIHVFRSTREAARVLGISPSHISECCNCKRKSIGGFIWKYAS